MTTSVAMLDRWQEVHATIMAGPNAELQEWIDSGLAWRLEGHVGRVAMDALEDGAAVLPDHRTIDYYGNTVPSYLDVEDEVGSRGSVANTEHYLEGNENA